MIRDAPSLGARAVARKVPGPPGLGTAGEWGRQWCYMGDIRELLIMGIPKSLNEYYMG